MMIIIIIIIIIMSICIYIYIYMSIDLSVYLSIRRRVVGSSERRPARRWHGGAEVLERNRGSWNHAEQRRTRALICRRVLRTHCPSFVALRVDITCIYIHNMYIYIYIHTHTSLSLSIYIYIYTYICFADPRRRAPAVPQAPPGTARGSRT